MSLRSCREIYMRHFTDDFRRVGCSSLAVVHGSAGVEALAGCDGTIWSFCSNSGNLLWTLDLGFCKVVATIPLDWHPVQIAHDTAITLETLSQHHTMDEILHIDPPARICKDEAAAFVAVQHADFVQVLCSKGPPDTDVDFVHSNDDRLVLGKLNRIPQTLRTELCEGKSLLPCRRALEAAGCQYKLPDSGAFVFVHPHQYTATMDAVACLDKKLMPDHVLFTTSFELMLEEALEKGG